MHPVVEQMLAVQRIEVDIRNLEQEARQLEPQLEQLRQEMERRQAALAKLEAKVTAAGSARRKAELELKTREEQISKARRNLEMVKTPKELEAATRGVETAQVAISELEDQTLNLLSEEETLAEELRTKKEASARLDAKAREQQDRLVTIQKEKRSLAKDLKEDRIVAANRLDAEHRDLYEWLVTNYGPTAVVSLRGEACGGCGGILVPNLASEVRQSTKTIQCPHCNRFLVNSTDN